MLAEFSLVAKHIPRAQPVEESNGNEQWHARSVSAISTGEERQSSRVLSPPKASWMVAHALCDASAPSLNRTDQKRADS